MSLNESSTSNGIEEITAKLNAFIRRFSITRFEGEDILELIQEGESVDWIVEQLKGNNPALDGAEAAALLTAVRNQLAPAPAADAAQNEPAPAEEAAMPDLSQVDLSDLMAALPQGMKLPPGFDVNQLKSLMESPQGQIMSDFALFCQEKGLDANALRPDDARVQKLQSEWKATPREAFDGKTPAQMLAGASGPMPGKVETFRREEPRVGRNDPCPCGSGKKYKKCCGRD